MTGELIILQSLYFVIFDNQTLVMMKKISTSNRIVVTSLHLLAWVFVIMIPIYITQNYFEDSQVDIPFRFYGFILPIGLLFYLNYLWLVPRYFFRDKKLKYFVLSFFVIWFVGMISGFFEHLTSLWVEDRSASSRPPMQHFWDSPELNIQAFQIYIKLRALGYFFISVFVWGFSFGLAILRKWTQSEREKKELEKEKLNSELAFLKNQISPHFFFNTLNNIYSLIGIDTKDAQEAVHKLSKLMRYLIYESERGQSKLSDEVVFMENYIDLMRLRLSGKVDLKVSFPKDCKDLSIPPLLFISFIENAFKHGVSYREKSFINISMAIDEKQIHFITVNSIGASSSPDDSQYGGIGLGNVKKRLALLYPEKHKLIVQKTEDKFVVHLILDI